jgi:hypothetical protein
MAAADFGIAGSPGDAIRHGVGSLAGAGIDPVLYHKIHRNRRGGLRGSG